MVEILDDRAGLDQLTTLGQNKRLELDASRNVYCGVIMDSENHMNHGDKNIN